jgi:hypothetical protein
MPIMHGGADTAVEFTPSPPTVASLKDINKYINVAARGFGSLLMLMASLGENGGKKDLAKEVGKNGGKNLAMKD